ncbi:MAG: hypothetical protein ACOX5T_09750 [Candidatus Cryptobacteroides sp.]|jgi:tetratricopeptide (TPR) repeat protein
MKKIAFALFTLVLALVGTRVSAQGKFGPDSAECTKYLSYYQEYFKQQNYDAALPNWRKAYEICPPTASQNMLINGTTLMNRYIRTEKDEKIRAAMIDTVLTLQDKRAEYYPRYATTALNNKAGYIAQYFNDPQILYDEFDKIIAVTKENTKPNIFLLDLNAAIELFKAGKLDAEEVIDSYQSSLSLLDKGSADSEERAKAKTDLESLFITSQVASCENLLELFTPRFEADPEDISLITNIVKMLSSTEGCQDNDLFLNAVTKLYKSEPSYSSAYYLYRLYSSRDEPATAVKYLEEAISFGDIDTSTKSDYLFQLATYCFKNGMNLKAVDYARNAAELDSNYQGKSNYLIGTVWGSLVCGGDEVEKRAHYWVAVDYLIRARNADPSLTEDANTQIRQYSAYFPQKAEAFMYDVVDGQSYTVSCGGMQATTTVRTQN